MTSLTSVRNCIVTALYGAVVAILFASAAFPQATDRAERLDRLFTQLADPTNARWQRAERAIQSEWSSSGSATADLLLQRGRDAMAAGDLEGAVDHLSALIDQAPDFAEGWNARATAYYLQGRLGLSIADIQRTLALEPRHFGALSGLGLILQELGNKPEAKRAFEMSLALNPHQQGIDQALDALERQLSGTDL